jgi:hypothetical protein
LELHQTLAAAAHQRQQQTRVPDQQRQQSDSPLQGPLQGLLQHREQLGEQQPDWAQLLQQPQLQQPQLGQPQQLSNMQSMLQPSQQQSQQSQQQEQQQQADLQFFSDVNASQISPGMHGQWKRKRDGGF